MILDMVRTYRSALKLVGPGAVLALLAVMALSLLAAAMEVAGLMLVLAILSSIVLGGGQNLSTISMYLPLDSLRALPLGYLLIGIGAAYTCKGAFMLATRWTIAKVTNLNEGKFAIDVFKLFVAAPMAKLSGYNTGHIIQKVDTFTGTIFSGVVMAGLNMASQAIMAAAVIAILLLVDVKVTLGAFLFMVLVGPIFMRLTHRATRHLGAQTTVLSKACTQILLETMHGLKEIKAADAEKFFIEKYEAARMQYAHVRVKKTFVQNTTSIYLETFAVIALIGLFGLMASMYGPSEGFVVLGLFAAATSRLMGYANQILVGVNQISFGNATVEDLLRDYELLAEPPRPQASAPHAELTFNTAVELRDVTFGYAADKPLLLNGLSFRIPRNSAVAIVGASGAGKSTLINVIAGLLVPGSGGVYADGQPIGENISAWKRQIGYVPQAFYMFDDTIRRNIALGVPDAEIDDEKVMEALKQAHLSDFIDRQPDGLDTVIGDRGGLVSGGQGQRLAIARALYRRPKLLILDEATSALDPATENRFMSEVLDLRTSMAIVFVTHRMAAAERCDAVYEISEGKLRTPKAADTVARHSA